MGISNEKSVPGRFLAGAAWKRVLREIRQRTAPRRPPPFKVGSTMLEVALHFRVRHNPRFFGLIPEQASLLAQFFPDVREITIQQADKIRAHRFDILGSGEVEMGNSIDWHKDFKSGHKWPVEHHTRLQLISPTGGFDVKVPWELSRFHHALRLGQAYLYTQDEFYAKEVIEQVTDWIEKNPYEFGVNWAGPMDVAIRAVNWIWTMYFVFESKLLTDKILAQWLTSLQQHGEYLSKNLEDGWPHTNHLIANLTGLAYIGILFPEFSEAARWRSTGLKRLWEELDTQIYPDGASYEMSTSYHRLVTEMLLSVTALCVVNNIDIPEAAQARIHGMVDYIMTYTQPDGRAPQVGDIDNGRLLPLTVHSNPIQTVHDHRHLLALGSIVLERELNEWAGFVEPTKRGWGIAAAEEWQDSFWYFASDAAARLTDVLIRMTARPNGISPDEWVDLKPGVRVRAKALTNRPISLEDITRSRGFEATGMYIMRHKDLFMTFDAGGVGTEGAGVHAHNDTLSITLHANGQSFLIDPGSYLYTSDPKARNRYRATSSHNTLQIGDREINSLPENLFRLNEDARTSIDRWVSHNDYDLIDSMHTGYTRFDPPIVHHRQIWFDKPGRLWVMRDYLRLADGAKAPEDYETDVTLWFHFAQVPVRLDRTNNAIRAGQESGIGLMIVPVDEFALQVSQESGYYSPAFGLQENAPVARYSGQTKLPAEFVLLLYPHQGEIDVKAARTAARAILVSMRKELDVK